MLTDLITVGIDVGARKVSWSIFEDGDLVLVNSWEDPRSKGRTTDIARCIAAASGAMREADRIYIEEPLIGRGVRASLLVAQTVGGLLGHIGVERPGFNAVLVPVKSWKKDIVGNGNASKEDVAAWLETEHESWREACRSQDEIDAICVGLYGVEVNQRAEAFGRGA